MKKFNLNREIVYVKTLGDVLTFNQQLLNRVRVFKIFVSVSPIASVNTIIYLYIIRDLEI